MNGIDGNGYFIAYRNENLSRIIIVDSMASRVAKRQLGDFIVFVIESQYFVSLCSSVSHTVQS